MLFMPGYSICLSNMTKYLDPEYLQMGSGISMFLGQGSVAITGYATGLLLNKLQKINCILLIFILLSCVVGTYFCALLLDCLGDKKATNTNEVRRESSIKRKTSSVHFANPEDVRKGRTTSNIMQPY